MPRISNEALYDVHVNPFNDKVGSISENNFEETLKWIEKGNTIFTCRPPANVGTGLPESMTGFSCRLHGCIMRNGDASYLDGYQCGQMILSWWPYAGGPSTATDRRIYNESPLMISGTNVSNSYFISGHRMRITALGMWIRFVGKQRECRGEISVYCGGLSDTMNQNADFNTYAGLMTADKDIARRKQCIKYKARQFLDGKKKFFASIPVELTQAKKMALPMDTEIEYMNEANNSTKSRPEWHPIIAIGTNLGASGTQCWEIGYTMKVEAVPHTNNFLNMFAYDKTIYTGDDEPEFEKIENFKQVEEFFRMFNKAK